MSIKRAAIRTGALIGLAVLATALLGWVTSVQVRESEARPPVAAGASPEAQGAAAFIGGGFGGISTDALSSNAVPWTIVAAALVLEERKNDPSAPISQASLTRILARFGFFPDATLANVPPGVMSRRSSLPLGMTHGVIAPIGGSKVRVANLGCAACHAGVTYDARGAPQPGRVMLGMPNSSINLEAYTLAVFQALRAHIGSDALTQTAQTLFPDMDWRERASLQAIVLPLARARLESLTGADRPLPFTNGAPGSTNGVAALRLALAVPLTDGGLGDAGVVSIPDLGARTWRTNLLVDGVYGVPSAAAGATTEPNDRVRLAALGAITTFFTVPSMGVHPDKARSSLPDGEAIMAFLSTYQAQPFPGPIDEARARRGQALFATTCASCHGTYDASLRAPRLTRFPNWRGDVGTDPLRATNFNAALADKVASSPYRDMIRVEPGQGYVAVPLAGLWASAPYLHNGSVPTLEALLDPAARPTRFQVGGHSLDFARVGINLMPDGAYPLGYQPFSTPAWIDTSSPGRSASGHRFGEQLSAAQRRDLIEYLKLL